MKRLERTFAKWILFHAVEFWYYYIGAFASLYFLHSFQSQVPELTKKLADLMKDNNLENFKLSYFLVLALAILVFRTLSRLLFFYPARIQQKNLRIELLGKVERAIPRSYSKYSAGQLFHLLYNDLNRLRAFIGFALLQLGNIIIAGFVFIPKLNEFNPDFLIAFLPMIVCVGLFIISMFFLYPIGLKQMEKYGDLQNFLLESYQAKHTIKNFKKEESFVFSFRESCQRELRLFFIGDFGQTLTFNLIRLGVAGSLVWASLLVYNAKSSSSDLIFFSGFLFLVLEPLMMMSWIGIVFSQGFGSWNRIKELLSSLNSEQNEVTSDDDNFVIDFWKKKTNFDISTHNWNVIVGETGVGKSYILESLAIDMFKNKRSFSFIQQEPFMYNDTVESNIFLSLDRTKKRIKKAHEYINAFGLDVLGDDMESILKMEIGENGKKISGGQAKRIALIRSLIADTDTVIWDDPFSSVDLILEDQILSSMKKDKDLQGKTFIFSSHRLSTIRNCDEILFVTKDEGVIEKGSVKELLNTKSRVNEYFKKQLV